MQVCCSLSLYLHSRKNFIYYVSEDIIVTDKDWGGGSKAINKSGKCTKVAQVGMFQPLQLIEEK